MARPRDYQAGETIPGTVYRVVRLIGAGGMGTVYDVEDTTVGKRYVLKTLHPDLHKRDDLAQRMVKEARQLARLSHPNIVEVVTAGATTDEFKLPYYVMEKLNGQSLHTILNKKGSLELPHALHIAIDLLDALDNAHDKGVIHRDVKPDNIFLHIHQNGQTVTKLLDFGIMKVLDEPGLTAGRFMGTLRYASPEQLRGETPMPQTDLYAAGLVLYEMIAGRGPFDDEGDSNKIAAAHLTATPPPLMTWGAIVPEALERLVRGSLSKDPLKRPKDAFTFASQLRNMNRAMAAERPSSSATSRPTEVPVLGPGTDLPSTPVTRQEGPAEASTSPSGGVVSPAALAATEHAHTRAGTPAAKAPATTPDREPSALPTAPVAGGGTALGMSSPPPVTGPAPVPYVGPRAAPATFSPTMPSATDRSPAPVDREAATRSAPPAAYPAPRGDGSTEPLPIAQGPAVAASAWRAPSTLRMSSAPARPDDGGASELLAGLPSREAPSAVTDGAASRTVSPRPGGVRPFTAIAIGVAMSAAMVATVTLAYRGVRSHLATPDPASVAVVPPQPADTDRPPPAAEPVAAPTIAPPLDLPPAPSAAAAAPSAATTPRASTSPSPAPPDVAPREEPSRSAEAPRPARTRSSSTAPAPSPAPSKPRRPGSGLGDAGSGLP